MHAAVQLLKNELPNPKEIIDVKEIKNFDPNSWNPKQKFKITFKNEEYLGVVVKVGGNMYN